jgi:peptidoglycan/xylan/chitin deacetylase (PgdA/CDA1 family)
MSAVSKSVPDKLKHLADRCSKRLVTTPGCSWLHSRITGRRHVIVTFHRIRETGQPRDRFDTCPSHTTGDFESRLRNLSRGHDVVPLGEFPNRLQNRAPVAAITFDDGWRDTYDLAFPLLQRMGLPATLFVTTGKIGQANPFWQQKLGNLFRSAANPDGNMLAPRLREVFGFGENLPISSPHYRNAVSQLKLLGSDADAFIERHLYPYVQRDSGPRCFVNEQEIVEMSRSCFTIGSHTCSHPLLDKLPDGAVRTELFDSKIRLESLLGQRIKMIAYPNGNVDARVVSIARELGYETGCTTTPRKCRAADDPMLLPRLEPPWDTGEGRGIE